MLDAIIVFMLIYVIRALHIMSNSQTTISQNQQKIVNLLQGG